MMDTITLFFYWFLIGAVWGVIEAWNRKVFFFIWIATVLLFMIAITLTSGQGDVSLNWQWRDLLAIPIMILGMFAGKLMYNSSFGERQ